jgi:hypothetical protein
MDSVLRLIDTGALVVIAASAVWVALEAAWIRVLLQIDRTLPSCFTRDFPRHGYAVFIWRGKEWEMVNASCMAGYQAPPPPDQPGEYVGQCVTKACIPSES